jgi:hypothetical protein
MRKRIGPRTNAETDLDDFLVRHTSKENVLFVLIGMEPHDIRDLAVAESLQTLPSFGIPQLHVTVIAA